MHIFNSNLRTLFLLIVRLTAGGIPFLFSLIVPYLTSTVVAASLFRSIAVISVFSSLMKLGLDMYILRRKDMAIHPYMLFFIYIFQSLIVTVVLIYFKLSVWDIVGSMLFGALLIIGSIQLSLGNKLASLLPVQLLFYPFLLVILKITDSFSHIVILALCLSLIITLPMSLRLSESGNLNLPKMTFITSMEYFNLSLYSVLSLIIANLPIVLINNFGTDQGTIELFQMVKFIGISSLVSSIYVFLYNDKMQDGSLEILKRDMLLILVCIVLMVALYDIFFVNLSAIYLIFTIITIVLVSFGNIYGFILVHDQSSSRLVISIILASVVFAVIYFVSGHKGVTIAFLSAVMVESCFKLIFTQWKR